jgi:hypothetical protein
MHHKYCAMVRWCDGALRYAAHTLRNTHESHRIAIDCRYVADTDKNFRIEECLKVQAA